VIAKIAEDIAQVSRDAGYRTLLVSSGAAPAPLDPARFASFVDAERNKYRELVKVSGARAD
jgi:tripartite-type tricarboxylate transporter receptor subunit TctC